MKIFKTSPRQTKYYELRQEGHLSKLYYIKETSHPGNLNNATNVIKILHIYHYLALKIRDS